MAHPKDIVPLLAEFLPRTPVPLHSPTFCGREWEYVKDSIDSGWVSYAGPYVDRFEHQLVQTTGVKYAIATSSGTAALHAALIVCGVAIGDEVLIPALTFVATANAVVHSGAVPHLVDSELRTLGIDADKLSSHLASIAQLRNGACYNRLTSRRIAAIVPMHAFGHPVDMDAILEVAAHFGIPVIEDAAESLGSTYKGRFTGTMGKASVLSFNGNKIVTTGGGGAILTNDPEVAGRAKHLVTTAKLPHRWEFRHDEVGYNYRMPSINAALGCAQLEQLSFFIDEKRRLAERYRELLEGREGIRFFAEPSFARSNYWLNAILIDVEYSQDFAVRDEILEGLTAKEIMARPAWCPMHRLPMYSDCPRADLSVAEEIERRLINLPSSVNLLVKT